VNAETHAYNGLPGPRTGSPPRAPGSVRRTTSLDVTRPDGPDGPIHVWGRARDLFTGIDGSSRVLEHGLVHIVVEDGVVTYLTTAPVRSAAARLVGRQALVGWRSALWRELRDDVEGGSALHLVLDDLPGGMIVGGFTRRRALAQLAAGPVKHPGRRLDVCAGWATGSRAARHLDAHGYGPRAVTPAAPTLVPPEDPIAWHTLPELPIWGLSRRRRIDVQPLPADPDAGTPSGSPAVQVDAMFRDSFRDGDGHEKVLHEYGITTTLDGTGAVQATSADPRVLPHLECPVAAASATQLAGMPSADLRDRVSLTLYGPGSCTHLNDLARSLADVPVLLRAYENA
jgi:hypothetical protein